MKNRYKSWLCSTLCLLLSLSSAFGQEKVILSGYIKNVDNGEALIQATVVIPELGTGAYTNDYGFYSISLPPGKYNVRFSYLGFKTITKQVELSSSQALNVELENEFITTEEVVIQSEAADQNVSQVEMSTVKLDINEVRRMPQLLGEVDIIRSIQLLPGVSTVGEGATGFNVRGGNVDQNLILLDESPVYNSSHLLGFFSVFNADAIKDIKLYKGGIPANFGGRLSSVLDVRQKEGNNKKFSGTGGVGLISSRLTLEGPIGSEKASFMVAGRRSYMDLFLQLSGDEDIRSNILYFYDLNAKVNYQVNDKNRIYLSGYFGDDVFRFENDFRMQWGNQTGSIRWNHLFSDKLFSNFSAVYSNYRYRLGVPDVPENSDPFSWTSHIINYSLKADFGYYVSPDFTLDFGASTIFYRFKPGEVDFLGDTTNFSDFDLEHEHALESGIYIDAEHKVNKRLTLQYGLRYSNFMNIGDGVVYQYEEGVPMQVSSITDTIQYGDFETIETFDALEPRFSFNYRLDEKSSVKGSYNRIRQYIHLVSNTTSATPLDVWKPSGAHVDPATVDQFALGYFRNFSDNKYETSVEVFYKDFSDLLDFKDGAELFFNETIETELLSGNGRAYGAEFLVRKKKGKWTGWLGYTLSRTERKVIGINNDEYYPSNYDKLHDLSLVLNYQLNDKWDLSGNFVYYSGRPVTYPDARYIYDGITVPNYSNRNGSRGPAYHRLDLSANWDMTKPGKKWEQSLSFGVYNAYGRRNAYSVFFRQNEDNSALTEAVRLSIFAIPIPYVTWNFSF